jgi:hypothetical protein
LAHERRLLRAIGRSAPVKLTHVAGKNLKSALLRSKDLAAAIPKTPDARLRTIES